jgi:hypothetical protein
MSPGMKALIEANIAVYSEWVAAGLPLFGGAD